jgi:peptidoglycan/xylan/chitin deacetylase (PgdA/CDA1 family)
MDDDRARTPLVLMYHSVDAYDADPYQVTVRPERFGRQMGWLRRRGLRGVSMAQLLRARSQGLADGLVGLTFDDGYTDFATEVVPVLARHGFTATCFVIAGALGGHNSWDEPGPRKTLMTAADLRRVVAAGIEIGSHSLTHVRLPEVPHGQLFDQVRRSRSVLAEVTGQPVSGFCYPYGALGGREVDAVREAGYDYACATRDPVVAGRHALARTFIGDRDSSARLFAKVVRHRLTAGRVPV